MKYTNSFSILYNTVVVFCLFLTLVTTLPAQSISRVEPANWWTGMRYNKIEVLFYGKDLKELTVKVQYPNVQVNDITTVSNPNYLFVTLYINANARPGMVAIDFYDGTNKILSHPFELKQREDGRANIAGFNSSDAIYMITPDRFVNGDPGNDNQPDMLEKADRSRKGGRHGGDIQGISQSLDYLKNAGFTALWINPLLENNMKAYSYHGYAITDLYKIDPRYGTNESYKQLVSDARSKGQKVIMDMVANHIGLEHWWMKDLPTLDWINQWAEFTRSNHKKTVLLDPYASQVDKDAFSNGWFDTTMPDLNQQNPLLAKYLIQNTIWWIEYAGISGIRMDTYPYPDMDFMAEWSAIIMHEYPDFNIVGEEWHLWPTVVSYWQEGKKNPNNYQSHLKSVMDFPLHNALIKALNSENSWTSSWTEVYESLSQDYLYPDPENIMVFPDNHDMSRIYTLLNENLESWKLAMTFLLTTRGIPCIYYGTEVLMTNPGSTDHGIIRSDFPGGWEKDTVNVFTGKGINQQQSEASAYLKKLLDWRKTADLIHTGQLMHFAPDNNDVYVYFRYDMENMVMILLNKNKNNVTLKLDKYREILGSATKGKDIISGKGLDFEKTLEVPARTAMVVEIY